MNIQFVKLSNNDFSYATKTFKAKEYPAELYKPVKPDEMRMTLINLNNNLEELKKEVQSTKLKVKEISEKPTFEETLYGFFVYNPIM